MKIRQNTDKEGAFILRFSDGVHERCWRGSLAFALGLGPWRQWGIMTGRYPFSGAWGRGPGRLSKLS